MGIFGQFYTVARPNASELRQGAMDSFCFSTEYTEYTEGASIDFDLLGYT